MMVSSPPWLHTESGPLLCTYEHVAPWFWLIPIFLILRLSSQSSSNCPAAPAASWDSRWGQYCAIILDVWGSALLSPVRPCSPTGASGLFKPPLSCSELKGSRGLRLGQMLIALFLESTTSTFLTPSQEWPTTQISDALQTLEMLESFNKTVAETFENGWSSLSFPATLGESVRHFCNVFPGCSANTFPKAFTLGQGLCRGYFNSERLAKLWETKNGS